MTADQLPVCDNLKRFLSKPRPLWIDGKWEASKSGRTLESRDPSTGEVFASFAEGDAESREGLIRALSVFENACFEHEVLPDRDVHSILDEFGSRFRLAYQDELGHDLRSCGVFDLKYASGCVVVRIARSRRPVVLAIVSGCSPSSTM